MSNDWIVRMQGVKKEFILHTQGNIRIPVLKGFELSLSPGESVSLTGPSGAGKSTVLRLLYGNYKACGGRILVRHGNGITDMAFASPHEILDVRRRTIGYVSQFLRVIPRVSAFDVVREPLKARGFSDDEAGKRASLLLTRLNVPERLWTVSPTTFSGGEQQRINIARGFAVKYPVMILDEPTASLDPANKGIVRELIAEAVAEGTAVLGIYHDPEDRDNVSARTVCVKSIDHEKGRRAA